MGEKFGSMIYFDYFCIAKCSKHIKKRFRLAHQVIYGIGLYKR